MMFETKTGNGLLRTRALGALLSLVFLFATPSWAGPDTPVPPAPRPAPTAAVQPAQAAGESLPPSKRFSRPPLHWDTLRQSVALTRQLVEFPPDSDEKRRAIIATIRKNNDLIRGSKEESLELIHYLVGSAFNNPDARAFFFDLEAVQQYARMQNPIIAELNKKTRLRDMMGMIGQDKQLNPGRFNYFFLAATRENELAQQWGDRFKAVEESLQSYGDTYHHRMRWYRRGSSLVTALLTTAGAIPGAVALLNHHHNFMPILPPDLQIMAGGILGLKVGTNVLHHRILKYGEKKVHPTLEQERAAIEEGFATLFEIDPERTAPFLISNVLDAANNPRVKPVGDLSLQVLMKLNGPEADRALVTLGIFLIKDGDGLRAREVFGELARRDPNGFYGKLWPQMTATFDELKTADARFDTASKGAKYKKAAIATLPAVAAVWAAIHFLTPEEMTSAVVVVRDLAIGELTLGYGEKAIDHLVNGNVRKAVDAAQAKLIEQFRKLPAGGTAGMDILLALADNKIPGPMGEAIAQAAGRAIREADGFGSAHEIARLGNTSYRRPEGPALVEAVNGRLQREQAVRSRMCTLDFAALVPKHR